VREKENAGGAFERWRQATSGPEVGNNEKLIVSAFETARRSLVRAAELITVGFIIHIQCAKNLKLNMFHYLTIT